jgi:hypothetical protein
MKIHTKVAAELVGGGQWLLALLNQHNLGQTFHKNYILN